VVTVVWKSVPAVRNLISHHTPALKGLTYEPVPAFILACLAIWPVSLLTRPHEVAVSELDAVITKGRRFIIIGPTPH